MRRLASICPPLLMFSLLAGLAGPLLADRSMVHGTEKPRSAATHVFPGWGWPSTGTIRRPDAIAAERMDRHRQAARVYRKQRELESEAARKAREADRAKWLRRWEEQRRSAREEARKREEDYREELAKRFPGLAVHRKRHADELEHRHEDMERLRQQRWADIDRAAQEKGLVTIE